MKKFNIFNVSLLLILAFSVSIYADTVVDINGQVRGRKEGTRKSFNADQEHMQTFIDLRTRVTVKATVDNNAVGFVQFQDSRRLGDYNQSGLSLTNNMNVDLHQAFLKYNLWKNDQWSLGVKVGRFEYNWGNQRLMGAVGWSNIGRAWEGGMVWYDAEKVNISLADLKALEVNDPGYNGDFDIYALAAKLKQTNLDLLFLYENNADTVGFSVPDIQMLKRLTIAAYYTHKMEQMDMAFNVALQTGKRGITPNTELDISAFMFTGEVGYSFEGKGNGRAALGIDYASGDDGKDADKTKTFNNLYWTGHKFNGYMDYFTGGGPNGLVDLMLRGKVDVTDGWTLSGDLHFFTAAQDYDANPDIILVNMTKDIGTELDLTLKTTRIKGIDLQFGASFFSAKDAFALWKDGNTDTQNGVWLYSQTIINF